MLEFICHSFTVALVYNSSHIEFLPKDICSTNYYEDLSPLSESRIESESYATTDGQSASLAWNKAPIWSLRRDFY
jgi:subtilisin-like proprotein convertase family protein